MPKRFLLLAGCTYYPAGWSDFRGDFAAIDEAVAAAKQWARGEGFGDWYEVIDLETLKVVAEGSTRAVDDD